MKKELIDIIASFKEAQQKKRKVALATVVHVEGSSYRRPGARMLVEENGKITGAISGGCLEGDALRKALLAMHKMQNSLVTYNTEDEDDVAVGVQLGCNGIVHILFEPIDPSVRNNPIALLEKCLQQRKHAVVATLFSLDNRYGSQPGTCFFYDGQSIDKQFHESGLTDLVQDDCRTVYENKVSLLKQYELFKQAAFVELLEPPVSLVIVGAGNDAMPMVEMAAMLGWQLTIIDGRPTHACLQRFPKAVKIITARPNEAVELLDTDERTAVVLMTHNYNYDLAMLECLLPKNCFYIGTLGPKKRWERLQADMQDKGIPLSNEQRSIIYGPTGLDIGAETAEEIALSVIAEIKSVLTKRQGSSLRKRQEAIHTRSALITEKINTTGE